MWLTRVTAVQNERDQIRVRRPAYDDQRSAAAPAHGITVATLHRAHLLATEVSTRTDCPPA